MTLQYCNPSRVTGYGTKEAIGDIDFFPNGGEHQPGCSEKPAGSALSGILHGAFGSKCPLVYSLELSNNFKTEHYVHCRNVSSKTVFVTQKLN